MAVFVLVSAAFVAGVGGMRAYRRQSRTIMPSEIAYAILSALFFGAYCSWCEFDMPFEAQAGLAAVLGATFSQFPARR